MSYTLTATLNAQLDVRETADSTTSPSSGAQGNQRVYDQYSVNVSLSGNTGSYPEIGGEAVDLSWTLSGGTTKDFDLTAVPWAGDVSKNVDKTGKKLVGIILKFDIANNAAGVTFGPQGANGYNVFGAGNVPRFYPGDNVVLGTADPLQATAVTLQRPAVAAGAKDVRFTGTDGDKWKCLGIFSE